MAKNRDMSMDGKFWNRLQAAMFACGEEYNKPPEDALEGAEFGPATKLRGDWLTDLRVYFKSRRWPNAERIEWEHVEALAKAAPEFKLAGKGTHDDPTTLTLAAAPGHKPKETRGEVARDVADEQRQGVG